MNDLTSLDAVSGEEEISRFKNECLGMAVLHLSYTALQTGTSLQDVAKQTRCGLQLSSMFKGRSESFFLKRKLNKRYTVYKTADRLSVKWSYPYIIRLFSLCPHNVSKGFLLLCLVDL